MSAKKKHHFHAEKEHENAIILIQCVWIGLREVTLSSMKEIGKIILV